MKLGTPFSILAFISIAAAGCVIQQGPPPPNQQAQAAPPATAAPTAEPAATPTAAPTATEPAPAVEDPNADIPADPEDPPTDSTPLPKQPAFDAPPPTPGLAEETAAGIGDGKPKGIEPAAAAAFWIWRNAGGIWKLRTTTAKKLQSFRGRIKGVQKPIGKVKMSRTELGDRMKRGTGGEVIFSFATMGHIDGLDFRAPKDACVRFDLQLDSGAAAKKVFIGKNAVSPKGNHFIVCPAK
jgi:hypothetical protein